ncbi:ABC transporter permease [Actinokineospora auranticolor]|uniref:Peptide/nickel transport system permease protein n=1 Tax=Actinokineospora auranticolor TaxID=155976 RepID=A0A2S6H1X0_9PSEU|nr:ABC transporter permease [Actinokineospora auranticolor]PPK71417.1 peptide/nickel transport system permease protein [Actinokineospora auranticolor]
MVTALDTPTPVRRVRIPRAGIAAALVVLAVVAIAALAPGLLTGVDPNHADLGATLRPPDWDHWFGTDQNGRDLFARVAHGAGASVLIGLGATGLALLGGIVIGTLAAQTGRWGDEIISRLLDVVLAVPGLLLVFLVAAVMGASGFTATIGLAVGTVPGFARVVRAEVLRVRASTYVEAAHGLGHPGPRVVLVHVVPNAVGPVFALATVSLGAMIVASSSLSFVGLGPKPPTAEWGAMLAAGRDLASVAWWPTVFPGVAITLTVLAVTVLGQHLQARFERRTV